MAVIKSQARLRDFIPRLQVGALVVVVVFLGLFSRLWYLQVVKGEDYFRFAAQNSFKTREISAPRGIIYGQGDIPIAGVRPSFDVIMRPAYIKRPPKALRDQAPKADEATDIRHVAQRLSLILDMEPSLIEERYYGAYGRTRYRAVVIKADVTREEIAIVEGHRIDLPGVQVEVKQKRTYPYGELFSHAVGYMGEVRSDELARLQELHQNDYYELGDYIGKYGVEKRYEPYLKGSDGLYYVQEDAAGRVVAQGEEVANSDYARAMLTYLEKRGHREQAGRDLHLTLDVELQEFIKTAMEDRAGAVVAMEPSSGRVLAMVNNPSFDPEIFVRGISVADWSRLRDDPASPLEDKVLRGQYPPGSIFKMLTGSAALMEGVATPSSKVYCGGFYKVGQRKFRCWKWASGGHGWVNLHKAIAGSCDTYFYHYSLKMGIKKLAKHAQNFGLGVPTGLKINQEKPGLIPTPAWKLKRFGRAWLPGETAAVSIGQGAVLMTPMQVANMISSIANDGHIMAPFLVDKITEPDGTIHEDMEPKEVGMLPIDPDYLRLIQNAMLGVTTDVGGTARRSAIPGIKMAGKTGTAQVVKQEIKDLGHHRERRYEDHAWFAGYAPFEHPEIVVSVLIEHGGHGSGTAAPIAAKVIKWYLKDRHETATNPGQSAPGSSVVIQRSQRASGVL